MPYGEYTYQYLVCPLMTSGSSELHWHKTAEVRDLSQVHSLYVALTLSLLDIVGLHHEGATAFKNLVPCTLTSFHFTGSCSDNRSESGRTELYLHGSA